MAKIDDYKQAKIISLNELSKKKPEVVSQKSGAAIRKLNDGKEALVINFLNRDIIISLPDMENICDDSGKEMPLQQQVLLLHYLEGCSSSQEVKTGEKWISFQDLPEGRFYMDAFTRRARDPLVKAFGQNPEKILETSEKAYNATPLEMGDFSVAVQALPMAPVALVLWKGDDEFPPEGNILFDETVKSILSAEDIATLAGMVVYPLTGMV